MEETTKLEVDLRAIEFTSSIDDNLICSVCHCPFIKPIITAECEHIFCVDCFERASSSSSSSSSSQQQQSTTSTITACPFCRSRIDREKIRRAPRAFSNMADDLKVKCPLWREGCDVISSRGSVQAHVRKYCDYAEVDCLGIDCTQKIARRELGKGCRHYLLDCRDCHDSIMALHLEEHREKKCPNRWTSCVDCREEILRCRVEDHSSICPEAVVECPGTSIGCQQDSMKRSAIKTHTRSCTFAALEPIFRRQDEKLKTIEEENSLLRRKIASLGDAGITTAPMNSQRNRSEELELSFPPLSPSAVPEGGGSANDTSENNTPFDSAVHHLLSSYESLRSDIDRVVASINELDARQSMLFMNESLRVKEDFSHINAIVGAMRIQLHWLMTTRLQSQQQRAGGGGMTGPSSSTSSGGTSSMSMLNSPPLTRLSDTMRQDTKL